MQTLCVLGAIALVTATATALAQQPAGGAAPPAWKQGMAAGQEQSPLHPFAPHLTGRAAGELPVNTLKVPEGFKIEVWADGVPEARSLALGDKGTVFVSSRALSTVYAIVLYCFNARAHWPRPPRARTSPRSRRCRTRCRRESPRYAGQAAAAR